MDEEFLPATGRMVRRVYLKHGCVHCLCAARFILPCAAPYTEKQVIAYAKSIDVKTLDPSLPSQRLDLTQNGVSGKSALEGQPTARSCRKADFSGSASTNRILVSVVLAPARWRHRCILAASTLYAESGPPIRRCRR